MDIFTPVAEQPKTSATFGDCELLIHDKTDKNGKAYKQVEFNILPVIGSKFIDVLNEKYGKFEWHSKPWDSHVLPSIIQLVNDGKITNAMDLNGAWVSVEWREWLSDRYNDVNYWENRAIDEENAGDAEKAAKSRSYIIEKDGKKHAKKRYLHFVDVFADEAACIAAYEERYGKSETVDDIPTGLDDTTEPTNDTQNVSFLASYITMTMANGKVDRAKLDAFLESNKTQFAAVNVEVIDRAVKKANDGMTDDKALAKFIVEEMGLPF